MEVCAGWNDTFDTIDDSDSGGGDGASCSLVNLSCAMDSVEEPSIQDTTGTDDICYAVNFCKQFSRLPIEHASVVETGVEEIPVTPDDNHYAKCIDSDAPIPSVNCGPHCVGAMRMVITQVHRINHHHVFEPTLELFIKPRNSNALVVSAVQSIISAMENLYSVEILVL